MIYNIRLTVEGIIEPIAEAPSIFLLWNVGPITEQILTGPPIGAPPMLQLTATQQCEISISAVDKKGNPAALDSVTFESSNPAVAAVETNETDESKALVVADQIGTAQIQVTADADLGEGVTNISGTLDITVVAGAAVSLAVTAGAPVEQP